MDRRSTGATSVFYRHNFLVLKSNWQVIQVSFQSGCSVGGRLYKNSIMNSDRNLLQKDSM